MVKKLAKHGDALALVLDQSILNRLGIDENTTLEIRTNGRGIYVQPTDASTNDDDLEAVMQQIEDRYESVFKKLAE
jgi:antitoxin component of MazEF toxin-antitoxin module